MFNSMLVCLDGSPLAEQILPYAEEQARRFGSEVVLLQVITDTEALKTPTTPAGDPFPEASAVSMEEVEMAQNATETYLSGIAAGLEERGIQVNAVAFFDPSPGQAIVSYAREYVVDLIAMVTHGRSGLGRAIMGSVADTVLRDSHLPLLIIRPQAE